MKRRQGFVSNSSSTSFCIYGTSFDEVELQELDPKYAGLDGWEIAEELISDAEVKGIMIATHPHLDTVYIGREYSDMDENETKAQFKERTTKDLNKIFGDNMSYGTIEEGWYNG